MAMLSLLAPEGLPEIAAGNCIATLIGDALAAQEAGVQAGDVIVIAQKIVSKAEGRQRQLREVVPGAQALALAALTHKDARVVELVLQESTTVLRAVPGVLIVEDVRGFVLANAGIDASNVDSQDTDETVLLLPQDPDASAVRLRQRLEARFGVAVAVIINDSWGRAWRRGTVGAALGVAGMPGLLDLRGTPDRQGRVLLSTEVGIADELAAAASTLMGQAGEGRPLVLIRGWRTDRREGCARELLRPIGQDLFR